MGGRFSRFDPVIAQYNASGELFGIEGHCQSACRRFLAVRNVCIDRNATLLFHAGGSHDRMRPKISTTPTNHMRAAYNAAERDNVTAHHLNDTRDSTRSPAAA